MEHFKKIKQLNQEKSQKQFSMTTNLKNSPQFKSSFLKYSVIKRPSPQQAITPTQKTQKDQNTFTIRNLDSNRVQLIIEDVQADRHMIDVQKIPNVEVLLDKIWNQYLSEVEKEEEEFLEACYQGDVRKVRKVVKSKSNHPIDPTSICTIEGQNGMHLAVISGCYRSLDIITLLAQYKVDINGKTQEEGRTPLMLGAVLGNDLAVRALLELGAEVDIQDNEGNSAMHHACNFQQQAIVELLLGKECSLLIRNQKEQTPIECIHTLRIFELVKTDPNFKMLLKQSDLLENDQEDLFQKLIEKVPERDTRAGTESVFSVTSNKRFVVGRKRQTIKHVMIKEIKSISLSSFKLLSLLGKGSFGEVFLVENTVDQNKYAMKCLDKSSILKQNILRYAMTERKILSTINHPFVAKLHFAFQTETKLILIMQYCPGGDLLRMIKKKGRIQENSLKKYVNEIVLALQELHSAEIIYRDLKPGNVIFDAEGHALLTDFGLSKEASLTHSFCGSTAYLAPEMVWRRGHTKVLDWYLLGVLIYQCLTGKPPFWDINRERLMSNIKAGRYRRLEKEECSSGLIDLVEKLLKSNSSKRLGVKGAKEVKNHIWFKNVDWKQVEMRKQEIDPIEETTGKPIYKQNSLEDSENIHNRIEGWEFIPNE